MTTTARAIVAHESGTRPVLEKIDVAPPQEGEALIRMVASGVCASDAHVINGRSPVARTPCVLGHEGAGIVEAVGPGVTAVAEGDHVVVALVGACGICSYCRDHKPWLCDGASALQGMAGLMADGKSRMRLGTKELYPFLGAGTMSEFSVVRDSQLVRIDDDIPLDLACLLGCGVVTGAGAAIKTAEVRAGDAVVVIGCGGVGLSAIQGARLAGATTIIAADTRADKLDRASAIGATHALDTSQRDLLEAVKEIRPDGVDFAFEVVGIPQLAADSLQLLRRGGTTVVVGSCPPGTVIPVRREDLMMERRIMTTAGGSTAPHRDIPRLIDAYRAGRLQLDEMVTSRISLDDFGLAFDALETGSAARSVIVHSH